MERERGKEEGSEGAREEGRKLSGMDGSVSGLGGGLPAKGSGKKKGGSSSGNEVAPAVDPMMEAKKFQNSKEASNQISAIMSGLGLGAGGANSAQLAMAMQEKLAGMIGAQSGFLDDLPGYD